MIGLTLIVAATLFGWLGFVLAFAFMSAVEFSDGQWGAGIVLGLVALVVGVVGIGVLLLFMGI